MKVLQCRRINERYSESVVWEGSRKKEAEGQIKHLFNGQLEMMVKHEIFGDAHEIDEEARSIKIFLDGKLWYAMDWRIDE